jgi:hypothetical protein
MATPTGCRAPELWGRACSRRPRRLRCGGGDEFDVAAAQRGDLQPVVASARAVGRPRAGDHPLPRVRRTAAARRGGRSTPTLSLGPSVAARVHNSSTVRSQSSASGSSPQVWASERCSVHVLGVGPGGSRAPDVVLGGPPAGAQPGVRRHRRPAPAARRGPGTVGGKPPVVDEEPGQVVGEFAGRPAGGVDTEAARVMEAVPGLGAGVPGPSAWRRDSRRGHGCGRAGSRRRHP